MLIANLFRRRNSDIHGVVTTAGCGSNCRAANCNSSCSCRSSVSFYIKHVGSRAAPRNIAGIVLKGKRNRFSDLNVRFVGSQRRCCRLLCFLEIRGIIFRKSLDMVLNIRPVYIFPGIIAPYSNHAADICCIPAVSLSAILTLTVKVALRPTISIPFVSFVSYHIIPLIVRIDYFKAIARKR